jgi:Kelch motif
MTSIAARSLALLLLATMFDGRSDLPVDRYATTAAAVGDRIIVAGGTTMIDGDHVPTRQVDILETTPGTWRRGADMPTARDFACAVALDDRVLVIGGLIDNRDATGVVEMYELGADRWTSLPPMPTARSRMGACVIDGKVYVAGGIGQVDGRSVTTLAVLERWDSASQAWSRLADMRHGRHGHIVVAYQGEVWVLGGYDPEMTASVEIYDPKTNAWRDGPALTEPRGFAVGAVVGDRIYVINSRSNAARTSTICEDGAWRTGPPVPDDRHRCGVAAVGSRIYLVSGDVSGRPFPLPHTIWLDTAPGEWGSVGP